MPLGPLPRLFFVTVASKGFSILLSWSESIVAGVIVDVASKEFVPTEIFAECRRA